jgi:hypothetical protein
VPRGKRRGEPEHHQDRRVERRSAGERGEEIVGLQHLVLRAPAGEHPSGKRAAVGERGGGEHQTQAG